MEKIDTLVKLKKLISEGKVVKVIYDSFYCDTLEDPHMTECLNDVVYNLSSLKKDSVMCGGEYEIYRLNKTDILFKKISSIKEPSNEDVVDDVTIYRVIK